MSVVEAGTGLGTWRREPRTRLRRAAALPEEATGAVVIEDPWTNAATGDTWVDAHLLPVPDPAFDAMAAVEADGFRGAVLIGAHRGRTP